MATIVGARVILGSPTVQRFGGEVRLTIPIMNVGENTLAPLQVTAVTLGSAPRVNPPGLPIVAGTLAASSSTEIAARFADAALATGSNQLLTIRASYVVNGTAYGLTLNRYVRVPAAGVAPPSMLKARVEASTRTNYWNYRIHNDEPAGSAQHVAAFSLSISAPVTVTGTPPGWAADTDNATYVLWFATDAALPYPSHVAPGATLDGFQLMSPRTASEASGSSLVSWDHAADQAGLVNAEYTLTPLRFA